ncbi:MAG: CDP-diacylglycerol--glycerol-3-phosphate 3-phosphatidyltransferase [Firmicutes bacterium]|nr:CDP-diacylglycerol--glycerol-3-phosphate 3-phosphatidyltransferase [Bacillota bacterium]
MNLPNKITVARICLVPVCAALALIHFPGSDLLATIVFLLAAFSDFLDGYLARSRNLVTNFGKFLDPLADKMLVCTAMAALVAEGRLSPVVMMIIICRDLMVDGLRSMAAGKGVVIAASYWGKAKTFSQIFMVAFLLMSSYFPESGLYQALCLILVLVATALTVISGVIYLYNGREFLRG